MVGFNPGSIRTRGAIEGILLKEGNGGFSEGGGSKLYCLGEREKGVFTDISDTGGYGGKKRIANATFGSSESPIQRNFTGSGVWSVR